MADNNFGNVVTPDTGFTKGCFHDSNYISSRPSTLTSFSANNTIPVDYAKGSVTESHPYKINTSFPSNFEAKESASKSHSNTSKINSSFPSNFDHDEENSNFDCTKETSDPFNCASESVTESPACKYENTSKNSSFPSNFDPNEKTIIYDEEEEEINFDDEEETIIDEKETIIVEEIPNFPRANKINFVGDCAVKSATDPFNCATGSVTQSPAITSNFDKIKNTSSLPSNFVDLQNLRKKVNKHTQDEIPRECDLYKIENGNIEKMNNFSNIVDNNTKSIDIASTCYSPSEYRKNYVKNGLNPDCISSTVLVTNYGSIEMAANAANAADGDGSKKKKKKKKKKSRPP